MVTDEERVWLTTEMARLIERAGLDSYVAAPLVEATDRYFPDEWHPDDGGVARLAKRVFAHAGLHDVAITAELGDSDAKRGITPARIEREALHLVVDPAWLTDPLTAVAQLVHLAAIVFRVQRDLDEEDDDLERRLIDLTAIYLGFGIVMTNAAYRYRASGELQGNMAITRWSHDEQGTLSASTMAYALAMQLVARGASPAELRAVRRQLETNQAHELDAATRTLVSDHVVLALGLPSRTTWPARRQPPAAPPPATLRLSGKDDSNLPTATVHRGGSLGYNVGRSVLRVPHDRRWDLAWLGMALGLFGAIPLAINGHAGAMLGIMGGAWLAGFSIGRRVRRESCSDPSCGVTLAPALARCSRCGGDIAGTLQRGENRLEAEERLGINQDDYDLDVGEPSESGVGLPAARVNRHAERHARVDAGSTDTSV